MPFVFAQMLYSMKYFLSIQCGTKRRKHTGKTVWHFWRKKCGVILTGIAIVYKTRKMCARPSVYSSHLKLKERR